MPPDRRDVAWAERPRAQRVHFRAWSPKETVWQGAACAPTNTVRRLLTGTSYKPNEITRRRSLDWHSRPKAVVCRYSVTSTLELEVFSIPRSRKTRCCACGCTQRPQQAPVRKRSTPGRRRWCTPETGRVRLHPSTTTLFRMRPTPRRRAMSTATFDPPTTTRRSTMEQQSTTVVIGNLP